ncbi:MAG: Spy/CpxP family protein refolding chaperone, partial [Acidobacteria bacterium]|nr:Spy/CpxP family protein refolding chaperone [Acidobacteriota bacterium]
IVTAAAETSRKGRTQMKMQHMLTVVALGATLISMPTTGQTQPAPPAPAELKAYLNLTDGQIQQLQDLRKQAQDSLQSVETQLQTKEQALKDTLDKGTADAAAVGKIVLEIHALRTQLQKAMDTAHQSALNLLTADQKTKLKTLEDAAKLGDEIEQAGGLGLMTAPGGGPGRPGGPGGPGGFGPPRF